METFDTYRYIKDLQDGNIPLKQAEAHSNALKKVLNDELATKQDLNDLEARLNTKMENLEARLNTKMDQLKIEIKENIISLIKWLVPLLLGQAALIIALLKYFGFSPTGG